jgi:hypothetical protein
VALLLAVNPTETEGFVQCFCVGDGGFSRILFENAQPNAVGLAMICGQPFAEVRGGSKRKNFIHMSQESPFALPVDAYQQDGRRYSVDSMVRAVLGESRN